MHTGPMGPVWTPEQKRGGSGRTEPGVVVEHTPCSARVALWWTVVLCCVDGESALVGVVRQDLR